MAVKVAAPISECLPGSSPGYSAYPVSNHAHSRRQQVMPQVLGFLAPCMGDPDRVTGSWLQPGVGESTSRWMEDLFLCLFISLSLSLCLANEKKEIKHFSSLQERENTNSIGC